MIDLSLLPLVDTNCYIGKEFSNLETNKQTTDKPYVYLLSYGSMLYPELNFLNRSIMAYKKIGLNKSRPKEDIWRFHAGVFIIPGKKLSFNKKSGNSNFGFANIENSVNDDYVICSVYIVPKALLTSGTGVLMQAEGCFDWDFYNDKNQYIILPNLTFDLINTDANAKHELLTIKKMECFHFNAGSSYLQYGLKPESDYRDSIVSQLKMLQDKGFKISNSYISYIDSY